jgi:hypothetical protein
MEFSCVAENPHLEVNSTGVLNILAHSIQVFKVALLCVLVCVCVCVCERVRVCVCEAVCVCVWVGALLPCLLFVCLSLCCLAHPAGHTFWGTRVYLYQGASGYLIVSGVIIRCVVAHHCISGSILVCQNIWFSVSAFHISVNK